MPASGQSPTCTRGPLRDSVSRRVDVTPGEGETTERVAVHLSSGPSADPLTVDRVTPADVDAISRLHCTVLPDGFLVRLGPAVLSEIYAGALTAPGVIGLVTRDGGSVAAFLLATADTRTLFRHVLRRRAPRLAVRLLGAALRDPRLVPRMLESLRYPATFGDTGPRRLPGAELIAIGVGPEHQAKGCARRLIRRLNAEFAALGVRRYTVAAYSSNEAAGAFYRKLGFERLHEFQMYGRAWSRYELRLDAVGGVSEARTTPA